MTDPPESAAEQAAEAHVHAVLVGGPNDGLELAIRTAVLDRVLDKGIRTVEKLGFNPFTEDLKFDRVQLVNPILEYQAERHGDGCPVIDDRGRFRFAYAGSIS